MRVQHQWRMASKPEGMLRLISFGDGDIFITGFVDIAGLLKLRDGPDPLQQLELQHEAQLKETEDASLPVDVPVRGHRR